MGDEPPVPEIPARPDAPHSHGAQTPHGLDAPVHDRHQEGFAERFDAAVDMQVVLDHLAHLEALYGSRQRMWEEPEFWHLRPRAVLYCGLLEAMEPHPVRDRMLAGFRYYLNRSHRKG